MTYLSSNSKRSLLLTVLGVLAAGSAVVMALVLRRSRVSNGLQPTSSVTPDVPMFPIESPVPPATVVTTSKPKKAPISFMRWAIFLVVLVVVSVGLILLQNAEASVSSTVFIGLLVASAAIGLRTYPQEMRQFAFGILHSRQWIRA